MNFLSATEAAAPTVEDTIEERTEPKAKAQPTPVVDTKKSAAASASKSASSAPKANPKKPTTGSKPAPKKK